MESARTSSLTRCHSGVREETRDKVAVEEPLEIRLDGHPLAVLMRTPGHDGDLTAGFLATERIVSDPSQIRKIDPRPDENRVLVFLNDGVAVDIGRFTRQFFTGSSCGLCGKATLESIFTELPPLEGGIDVPDEVLFKSTTLLRKAQGVFDSTGGLHAAGIFSKEGELRVIREDIGRHNAVDKVIGHSLMEGLDLSESFLLVSGRVSIEIMQKALAGRIPLVAAISAPSSLAVDFAKESGQQLVAFLRPPSLNRYT